MNKNPKQTLPLVPFLIADVLFLALAVAVWTRAHRPLLWWEACLIVGSGGAAACSLIAPFLRRDANEHALIQSSRLVDFSSQLRDLEQLAGHIHAATQQWKALELQSAQTHESAIQLSQSLSLEARSFAESVQKQSDNEKAHLRLEVEKLRRTEGEWLQAATRILDHVFALFQAAQRSGQRGLIEQITLFQESCREVARRVGLAPMTPRPGDLFDARVHQLPENVTAPEKAVVADTLATGFTYQGQLIRRAFVALRAPAQPAPVSQQDDLPMPQETQP